jgi:hypothetical protein
VRYRRALAERAVVGRRGRVGRVPLTRLASLPSGPLLRGEVILSHHGHDAIRRSQTLLSENLLIEGRSFELPYLPFYSPNFNPIEVAFSKIKDK